MKTGAKYDTSRLEWVDNEELYSSTPHPPLQGVGVSPMMRCPLPPIDAKPDSLRYNDLKGMIPQTRVIPPTSSQSNVVTNTTTRIISSGTSSAAVAAETIQSATVTSDSIASGEQWLGLLQIAKSFDLFRITVTQPARVRLYSTVESQINDSSRGDFQTNAIGLITDVSLESDALKWLMSPAAPGFNGDDPATPTIYITIDNTGTDAGAITVSLTYEAS